jgi:hypothetical protein
MYISFCFVLLLAVGSVNVCMAHEESADSASFQGVIVPRGFYQEGGSDFSYVAVGSKNGRMLAVSIKGGKIFFFNNQTMSDNPWIEHTARDPQGKKITNFTEAVAASDGTVYALTADGIAYRYNWTRSEAPIIATSLASPNVSIDLNKGKKHKKKHKKHHKHVQQETTEGRWLMVDPGSGEDKRVLKHLAVGNIAEVWALDDAGIVCRLEDETWTPYSKDEKYQGLAVGHDGKVIALDSNGKIQTYVNGQWQPIPSPRLTKISVANKDLFWGIGDDNGSSVVWKFEKVGWLKLRDRNKQYATGLSDISVNPAGTVFALDRQGRIYANGEEGVPVLFSSLQQPDKKIK